jgi:general secretion pathway protein K
MKAQRGAAVIVALLLVALATIVAGNFMFRTHLHARKLENAVHAGQAHWLLRAAEQWAAAVLQDDALQNSVDHLGETWHQEVPPLTAEGYRIAGRIFDQDGRFNLNNLVQGGKADEAQLSIFRRLLVHLQLPAGLADAVADWLDADDEPIAAGGAENDYYRRQLPPLRAANRLAITLDEFQYVRGMTPERLERLRPHVAVLPRPGPVNVNTASPEVIAALSATMSLDDAYALAAKRDQAYFRNQGELRNAQGGKPGPDERHVAFTSRYFLVIGRVSHDRIALESRALFERGGRGVPILVWRTVR